MSKLDLSKLESIIENLEVSRENIKNILEEQGATLFHSMDYYKGQLNVYSDVITMLKLHLKKATKNAVLEADKMFEDIDYQKDKDMPEMYCKTILPFKKQKDIQFDIVTKEHIEIRMSQYNEFGEFKFDRIVLSIQELQAINKKIEELGRNVKNKR